LTGSNTYSGGTIISMGTLQLGSDTAFPLGGATVNGTLDMSGHSASVTSLTGTGTIDSSNFSNPSTLSVQSGNFAGTLQTSAGTLSLIKTGSGTLVLSGSNTLNGGITVADGKLIETIAAAAPDGSSLTVGNAGAFPDTVVPPPGGSSATAVSPVPEPCTLALFAAGAAAVFALRRRRRTRRLTMV
jgi:autotransporter-associated beta strand protein